MGRFMRATLPATVAEAPAWAFAPAPLPARKNSAVGALLEQVPASGAHCYEFGTLALEGWEPLKGGQKLASKRLNLLTFRPILLTLRSAHRRM